MKLMRGVLLSGAMLLATAVSGHAQSAVNWTGPYVGVGAGGTWMHYDATNTSTTTGAVTGHGNGKPSGAMIGLVGGYDYMLPWNMVIGGAIDGYIAGISGSATGVTTKTNALGTARLRVGYAIDRFLPYATAGLAWQHSRASFAGTHDSDTTLGWTVGGGVDYAIGNLVGITNLVVGAEYRYSQYGDEHFRFSSATTSTTVQHLRSHTALVTLTYHFGMTPPPPAPTPVAAPPAPPPAAVAPSKQMFIVFFEFDKSSLTPDGRKVVDAAAAAFKAGKRSVAIAGYTDLAGTQQYNLALSKRRADTVKAALVRDGVPASAIDEAWHGKENPRVPTADGVREPQNRRVEITM